MARVEDIEDRESFKAWLNARPEAVRREEAVALATRAAARVFPIWCAALDQEWVRKGDLTALLILRIVLISSVAVKMPTEDIRLAAYAAYAADAANTAAYAAAAAADAAADAANTAAYAAAAAADDAAYAAAYANANLWELIRFDARAIEAEAADISSAQLWHGQTPEGFGPLWEESKTWLKSNPGHDFWIRWYETLLAGRPLTGDWESHWQMLHDIALIDAKDWDKGAEHMAPLIAEIEARYRPDAPAPVRRQQLSVTPTEIQTALRVNRLSLPPTLSAVFGHLELEIRRLQGKNDWPSVEMQEDARALIVRLTAMAEAIQAMIDQAESLPEEPSLEDAEKTKSTWEIFLGHAAAWPKQNVEEIVDSSWRLGLTGITGGTLAMCGVAHPVAFGVAAAMIGGKKVIEAVKTATSTS